MNKQLLSALLLLAYFAILVKVMVFKDLPLISIGSLRFNFGGTRDGPANLVPFNTILPYLQGGRGMMISGVNLVGNIVLLVPIGFLVAFGFPDTRWSLSLIIALTAGLAIEGLQAVLHVGIFDVDDIILNAVGVLIGNRIFRMTIRRRLPS